MNRIQERPHNDANASQHGDDVEETEEEVAARIAREQRRRQRNHVTVDIWERNKELIRKRTDIGEHFTREIFQSIVFIFLPLGERVHLINRSITTNPSGTKNVFRCE